MISTTAINSCRRDAAAIATNIRRLMARDNLTFDDVVAATGLDERTLRSLVRGRSNPHARTLHKLAQGLAVEIDELFQIQTRSGWRRFDRATNALVENIVLEHPEVFEFWGDAQFDELYSRFGTGNKLTPRAVLAAAESMNARRELWRQVGVILESSEREFLAEFVEILYRRAVESPTDGAARQNHGAKSKCQSQSNV